MDSSTRCVSSPAFLYASPSVSIVCLMLGRRSIEARLVIRRILRIALRRCWNSASDASCRKRRAAQARADSRNQKKTLSPLAVPIHPSGLRAPQLPASLLGVGFFEINHKAGQQAAALQVVHRLFCVTRAVGIVKCIM